MPGPVLSAGVPVTTNGIPVVSGIFGPAAFTEIDDVALVSVEFTVPLFEGSVVFTELLDVLEAEGTYTLPPVAGDIAFGELDDTLEAEGIRTPPPEFGGIVFAEEPETLTATGFFGERPFPGRVGVRFLPPKGPVGVAARERPATKLVDR